MLVVGLSACSAPAAAPEPAAAGSTLPPGRASLGRPPTDCNRRVSTLALIPSSKTDAGTSPAARLPLVPLLPTPRVGLAAEPWPDAVAAVAAAAAAAAPAAVNLADRIPTRSASADSAGCPTHQGPTSPSCAYWMNVSDTSATTARSATDSAPRSAARAGLAQRRWVRVREPCQSSCSRSASWGSQHGAVLALAAAPGWVCLRDCR